MHRVRFFPITMALAVMLVLPPTGYAGDGSVIDRRIHKVDSGVWNPVVYRGLAGVFGAAYLGGALWEGSESRLGKTLWRTMDSQILAVGSATVMKYAFARERPSETRNPDHWFSNGSNHSFPSVETALSTSLVTPFVMEYGGEHPASYGLLLLPFYVGVARVKNQEHWQSDVLAGWAVGGLSGYISHRRKTPFVVQLLPNGGFVGLKTRF